MSQNRRISRLSTRQGGFTLTELVVTVAIMLIVILALGTVIADSIRGWHKMYARVYADVVTDGYVARNAFDRVVRSAGRQTYRLAADGAWLEVYYYSGPSAITLDRYACFKVLNGELQIEHGDWKPGTVTPRSNPTTETVCGNVSSCIFGRDANGDGYGDDYSPQMKLTLNDGTLTRTVVSSAVMHNGS